MLLSPSPIVVGNDEDLCICVLLGDRTQFNGTCLCKEWAKALQCTSFEVAFVNLVLTAAGAKYGTVVYTHSDAWIPGAVNKSWLPGVLCCQTLNVLSVIKNRFSY